MNFWKRNLISLNLLTDLPIELEVLVYDFADYVVDIFVNGKLKASHVCTKMPQINSDLFINTGVLQSSLSSIILTSKTAIIVDRKKICSVTFENWEGVFCSFDEITASSTKVFLMSRDCFFYIKAIVMTT